jgi:hypothetical protein
MNNRMNTVNEVLGHIEEIVWSPHTSDIEKTHAVQGLLYTWGQMQDARSDQMFGDEEAHVDSPNFRRM